MPLKGAYTPYETGRIQMVLDYIHAHYKEDISTYAIMLESNLDAKVFYPLFQRQTGLTVHNYLVKFRIEKSKADLGDFSLNVAEVARKNGFHSGSKFSKKFRELTGMSPTDYRYTLIKQKE